MGVFGENGLKIFLYSPNVGESECHLQSVSNIFVPTLIACRVGRHKDV
jgi:hypothetical protein